MHSHHFFILGFVCIILTFKESSAFPSAPPNSSNGYKLYSGHGLYKFHKEVAEWQDAKQVCESEGAHLAVVNTQAEADFLLSVSNANYCFQEFWVGFSDIETEGNYITVLGNTISDAGYSKLKKDDVESKDCGRLRQDGLLDVSFCYRTYKYICEK